MRVLIIGGTALIGPHVISELYKNGIQDLHTITRSGKSVYCETSHAVDRRDLKLLYRKINEINPDVLIDMIPFTAKDAYSVVTSVSNLDISVIAISSIDVYAAYASLHQSEVVARQDCPLKESMVLREQLGPEGHSYDKLAVESIYTNKLKNICVLRLAAIYGWPDCTRVSHYLDQMLDGATKIALEKNLGGWKFSRCFHKNAAFAITLAVLAKKTGKHTYNVAEETVYSERQWIEKIAEECGWNGSIIEAATSNDNPNWLQHLYVSTEKIRAELGYYDKYSTSEGLADTIAFHAYERKGVSYKKYY